MYKKVCMKLKGVLGALKRDERGVSALEYVILAAVVVAAVIAGGTVLKDVIESAFSQVGSAVSSQIDGVTGT